MVKRITKVPKRTRWWIGTLIAVPVLLLLVVALVSYLRCRQAKQDVDLLALTLDGFAFEHSGRYPRGTPAQIAALLRGENVDDQNPKQLDYIEAKVGEMNADGEFIDPWRTPYRMDTKGGGRAYSYGSNRIDEHGNGDDIASWK
jgi:hypothetical protein